MVPRRRAAPSLLARIGLTVKDVVFIILSVLGGLGLHAGQAAQGERQDATLAWVGSNAAQSDSIMARLHRVEARLHALEKGRRITVLADGPPVPTRRDSWLSRFLGRR